jgi:hypothetical protein
MFLDMMTVRFRDDDGVYFGRKAGAEMSRHRFTTSRAASFFSDLTRKISEIIIWKTETSNMVCAQNHSALHGPAQPCSACFSLG